jgi:hypothetical protein
MRDLIVVIAIVSIVIIFSLAVKLEYDTENKIHLPKAEYYCAEKVEIKTQRLITDGKSAKIFPQKTKRCATYKLKSTARAPLAVRVM